MGSVLIGSVGSSKIVLEEMIKLRFPVDMVFSLDEEVSENVSGYYPLHELAMEHNTPFCKFRKVNSSDVIAKIAEIKPEYIFVIGLSQIIPKEIINLAAKGAVGFHPTPLPKYRGRAAMVWQVLLGVHETKCSMFMIDEGMDSGDILGQEPYIIEDTDYAEDVEGKLLVAIRKLAARVLKQITDGTLVPWKQNDEDATYLLIRRPDDGLIDWKEPVEKIQRLIRAVSKPYPGAFGMYDGSHQVIIWKADYLENKKYIGIPGQICEIHIDHFDVVGVDGLIRVYEFDNVDNVKMRVGHKLK